MKSQEHLESKLLSSKSVFLLLVVAGAFIAISSFAGRAGTGSTNTGDRNTGTVSTGVYTGTIDTGSTNTGTTSTGSTGTGTTGTGEVGTGTTGTGTTSTGEVGTGTTGTGTTSTGEVGTGTTGTGETGTGTTGTGATIDTGAVNTGSTSTGSTGTGGTRTGVTTTGLISFQSENFLLPSEVHDGYGISNGAIVPMDGLENTTLDKGYLKFGKTLLGTYQEVIGSYTASSNDILGYVIVETSIKDDKNTTLSVKGVDANMNVIVPETFLLDGPNSVPVNSSAPVYFIFTHVNKKDITTAIVPKVFVITMVYGNKNAYGTTPMLLKNQVYATENERQKLDIYRAPGVNGATPLVMYMHGGGFTVGDKGGIVHNPLFRSMLEAGISVASMNYRFFDFTKFPKNLDDVALALQYTKANSAGLNIDGSKVGLLGSSAGGMSVSLFTMRKSNPDYTKFNKSSYNLPTVLGDLLYVSPAGFTREYMSQSVGCDTSAWTKILKYFGLPLIKLPGKVYDWTEYYNSPSVAIEKVNSLLITHITNATPSDSKPKFYFSYDGVITNGAPGSTEDDCLHSPNHFLMIKDALDQKQIPNDFYHGGGVINGATVGPRPSTLQGELSFIKSLFLPQN